MNITIRSSGVKEAIAGFRRLPPIVRAETTIEGRTSAERVAREAGQVAPVRTGRLRAAIGWKQTELGGAAGVDETRAPYWRHVEFGTVRTPARPMFRPAIERQRGHAQRNLDAAIVRADRKAQR